MTKDFRKVFAMKAEREKRIKKICPDIPDSSGIYVFYRIDEAGIRRAYCGQAVNLLERCASHLGEYDHIALSLKKHGFYSNENPYGWKVASVQTNKSDLDEMEQHYIKQFANAGYQLRNKTSGSQGVGKKQIDEYRPAKGYRDGVQQGKISLARDLKHIIDKHLTVELKPEKQGNKVSMKALEKFNALLDENNYKPEQE